MKRSCPRRYARISTFDCLRTAGAALDIRDQRNDIWIWDFARQTLTRLTTDPGLDQAAVWTPDGRRIVYASNQGGVTSLYWKPADGSGSAERLTTAARLQLPWTITPDGKTVVMRDTDPTSGQDISLMALDGDRAITPLLHSRFNESNADISPDGKWIAYGSNESNRDEIHVRPFPAVNGGHWQVSTEGGTRPAWARNGRELFYVDLKNRIMSVPVQTGTSFVTGNPAPVVTVDGVPGVFGSGRNYDVSPDGQRFLVIRTVGASDKNAQLPQLNVVLNWGEEVKRLASIKK